MRRLGVVIGLLMFFAAPAFAGQETPFTWQRFTAAQRQHRPILVHIAASWCPTCAEQVRVLGGLTRQPKFRQLLVLRVSFDHQKAIVRYFHAFEQSTLIAFRGAKEVGRSVGDTDPQAIGRLLRAATGS